MRRILLAPALFPLVASTLVVAPVAHSAIVSTAHGNGSDVEMQERSDGGATNFTQNAVNGTELNTRTASNGTRNEIVGLRFDLAGYSLSDLTNVTLNLTAFRTDGSTRIVNLYGVTQGTAGGTGTYTTETWSDTALDTADLFGDLPGLLNTDNLPETQSLNLAALNFLMQINIPGNSIAEGDLITFSNATITSFIQDYTGSDQLTFILAAGNGSSGQWRTTSKEATSTDTGVVTGAAGDLAPFLEFDIAPAPPETGLTITHTELIGGDLALSGEGGTSNGAFALLASSDLSVPSTNWPPISTNTFDGLGNFLVFTPVAPGAGQQFYRLLTLANVGPIDPGPMGFATVNGGVTGGNGGTTQTVSTVSAFTSAVAANDPRVIYVDGTLDLNGSGTGSVNINSHKTIIGLGTNAGIVGQLQISAEQNVIIRNLTISNNGAPSTLDGVRVVSGAHNIWVDHCTFIDCSDGSLDITVASDYVTVSWCKFMYVNQTDHRFVNLIAASDDDAGDYRITFHNNWWSTGCDQRMPASRYGTVHLFNNYWFAPGNGYCSNARTNAQFLSENNYYREVDDPIYATSNGRIKTSGNIYDNTTGQTSAGTDTLDPILTPPPYAYTLEAAVDVPSLVTNGAGVGKGFFAP